MRSFYFVLFLAISIFCESAYSASVKIDGPNDRYMTVGECTIITASSSGVPSNISIPSFEWRLYEDGVVGRVGYDTEKYEGKTYTIHREYYVNHLKVCHNGREQKTPATLSFGFSYKLPYGTAWHKVGHTSTTLSSYAKAAIDDCRYKYIHLFGAASGDKYSCSNDFYWCQRTKGPILTKIAVHKKLQGVKLYYYVNNFRTSDGKVLNGWENVSLNVCD